MRRRRPMLPLAILAMASIIIFLLLPITPNRHFNLPYAPQPLKRRQLFKLAQFNDPTSVEYKQPALVQEPNIHNPQYHSRQVKPYNIDSAILAIKSLRYQGFFFVYHSQKDEFVVIHNHERCDNGCVRVYRVASILSYALRNNFPQRFNGEEDWVVVLSTGDVPRLHIQCLSGNHCQSIDFAPILSFGSMYDASILPSGIAMPMPVKPHLPCFEIWQQSVFRDQTRGNVCGYLLPEQISGQNDPTAVGVQHGLIFADELSWNSLIPQIIWRGTDFMFLHTMFQGLRVPDFEMDVKPKVAGLTGESDVTRAAIKALWGLGNDVLLPRWRGVLFTSQAELEVKELTDNQRNTNNALPWLNIKFASSAIDGKKVPASKNPNLISLQSVGISAIGEYVSMQDQARYKYHIDLGGGGGTTWTGTIEKLAMPGVLFHHVTPTTDYFYNRLIPWVHYIPVRADLADLREQYDWAESHPEEAQKIARAGTEFAKWIGTFEGFKTMYQEYLVDPLKASIDAYIPMNKGKVSRITIMDAIDGQGESSWNVVAICSGLHVNSCRDLNGGTVI